MPSRFSAGRITLAAVLGAVTAWALRDEATALLLHGKGFAERSWPVQGLLLASLTIMTAGIWYALQGLASGWVSTAGARDAGEKITGGRGRRASASPSGSGLAGLASQIERYLSNHAGLIAALMLVALAAYGFEIFNLNFTLDEEYWAFFPAPPTLWLATGRWGVYLLSTIFLPYTIMPVVPISLALVFHVAAALILCKSWGAATPLEQFLVAAAVITFPSTAFMYAFSTLNFAVGIGYFCVALSLAIVLHGRGWGRLLAAIPALLALSIHQGFMPAQALVFVVYIALVALRTGQIDLSLLGWAGLVGAVALAGYLITNLAVLALNDLSPDPYSISQVDLSALVRTPGRLAEQTAEMAARVYSGAPGVFGIQMYALSAVVVISCVCVAWNAATMRASAATKFGLLVLAALILLLPFSLGIVTGGGFRMRWLLGLPIGVAGLTLIAVRHAPASLRVLVAGVAAFAVFQFIASDNRLFGAAYSSAEADRLLAARLIARIDEATSETASGQATAYLEIVGTYKRPPTALIPRSEIFGVSFFEWDGGDASRVLKFLSLLGYSELEPLPAARRASMIDYGRAMPEWPDPGSVDVVGDTVIVRFGSYSYNQRQQICGQPGAEGSIEVVGFCDS